jgi:hypothetical protein
LGAFLICFSVFITFCIHSAAETEILTHRNAVLACIDAYGWSWSVANAHVEAVNILSARQPVGRGRTSLVLVDRAFVEDGGRFLRLVNAGATSVDVAGSPVEVVDSLVEVEEFAEGLEHTTGFVTLEAEVIQGMASGTSKYGNKMWTLCNNSSGYHCNYSLYSGQEETGNSDKDESKQG